MVCGVLYGCFGLLLHKNGCYFQNFIWFQIEILLYNMIMQNTLDQLAVGTFYKSVCYFICEEVHGFSGKMLIADCHYLHIFLYLEEDESI